MADTTSTAVVAAKPKGQQGGSAIKSKGTPAALRKRSEKYEKNITKRGFAALDKKKKEEGDEAGPRLSPWVVAGFIVVLVGSAIVQVLSTATSKPIVG